MLYSSFITLALAMTVSAGPMVRRQNAQDLKNGQDAIAEKYDPILFVRPLSSDHPF